MKLDVVLKNVGCTVTKMLDQNSIMFGIYGLFSLAQKRYGEIFLGISLLVFIPL